MTGTGAQASLLTPAFHMYPDYISIYPCLLHSFNGLLWEPWCTLLELYFWHFSDTVLRNADHSCWRGGEATCWGQHWAGVGAGGGGRRGHVGAERQIWWKFTRKNTFLSTVGGPAEQTSCEDEHWEFVDFKCWVSHQCMCAVPHLWECTHGRENVCLRVTVHVNKTPIKRNDVDLSYLHSSLRGPKSNSHTLATGLSLSVPTYSLMYYSNL